MQQISAQEKEIMQIIWDTADSRLTARDIEARMAALDGKRRNLSSVMTVIARLVDKGFLEPVKKFRQSTYYVPLVQETEYKAHATKQFINAIHGGKLSGFVSMLLDSDQFTQQELEELRGMLDGGKRP